MEMEMTEKVTCKRNQEHRSNTDRQERRVPDLIEEL